MIQKGSKNDKNNNKNINNNSENNKTNKNNENTNKNNHKTLSERTFEVPRCLHILFWILQIGFARHNLFLSSYDISILGLGLLF